MTRDKRAKIHGQIAAYQAPIAQAKHDLAHVNATIRMFHRCRVPTHPLRGEPRHLQKGRAR